MVMNPRTHPRGARPDFALPRPNPNPARMTNALWWMVCMCEALEPASQNGGTFANKAGSHNAGENLPDHGEGDPRTDHSIRHAWNRTGPWWREFTAGRDWTFPDAQRGDYVTINKYTRRVINAMKDPDDLRTDRALFYVLGNTDGDIATEGYNEIKNGAESSGDDSHAWHIHESWFRDNVGKFGAMWAVLTVYMGWSYSDYLRSIQQEAPVSTDQFSTQDEAVLVAKATQGTLGYSGGGLPLDLPPGSNLLAYFREWYLRSKAQEADVDNDLDLLGAYCVALMNDVAAIVQDPADMTDPEQHPVVRAVRYAQDNPAPTA
jgi:hypothetical protein